VTVCFVNIGGTVDYHCLSFLVILYWISFNLFSLCWAVDVSFHSSY